MRATLTDILPHAQLHKYAVGAFNFSSMETAQAIVAAAERAKSPVVLQTSGGAIEYAGMVYLGVISWVASQSVKVPVVVHLDHGHDVRLVRAAIASGYYTSVMIDASHLAFKDNIKTVKKIVDEAHAAGISVEAELGPIPGREDKISVKNRDAFYTDPAQAAEFVDKTGCDALAVSVGTAHGAFKHTGIAGMLDVKRLAAIASAVNVPLVLHGASSVDPKLAKKMGLSKAEGMSDADIKKAIKTGITKINIDTDLRLAYTSALRTALAKNAREFDPRVYTGAARDAVQAVVEKKLRMFGSAGK